MLSIGRLKKEILLVIISVFLTLLFCEFLFYLNDKYYFISKLNINKNQSVDNDLKDDFFEKKLNSFLLVSPYRNWKHQIKELSDKKREIKKYRNSDVPLGLPNQEMIVTAKFIDNNDILYKAKYTFDELGFRKVNPDIPYKNHKKILFLGCSFTFGEGLNDNETSAYFFQNLNKKYKVLNYGFPGYGPNDILFDLENNVKKTLGSIESVEIVIYTMLEDHIERASCSMRYCFKDERAQNRLKAPMYKMQSNGELKYYGAFKDNFPWNQIWLNLFKKSSILNSDQFQINHEKRVLTVKMLNKIKMISKKKWNVKKFIVALYPGYWSKEQAIKFKKILKEYDIEYIDFTNISINSQETDFYFPYDHHPTVAGAYLYAWMLNEKIMQ
jgi:hypothetical protein